MSETVPEYVYAVSEGPWPDGPPRLCQSAVLKRTPKFVFTVDTSIEWSRKHRPEEVYASPKAAWEAFIRRVQQQRDSRYTEVLRLDRFLAIAEAELAKEAAP